MSKTESVNSLSIDSTLRITKSVNLGGTSARLRSVRRKTFFHEHRETIQKERKMNAELSRSLAFMKTLR